MMRRQTDIIRENILKQIMDILGVDELTGRAYRSALWTMIKEKQPEIVGNLEKHIEMEKLVTEETLKGIDEKTIARLKKIIEEKTASRSSSPVSESSDSPEVSSDSDSD